jgi:hypothetical protein
MDSMEYVALLKEEAQLEEELTSFSGLTAEEHSKLSFNYVKSLDRLHAVKDRLYDLQQEMLRNYGRNVAPSMAIAEADHAYDSYVGANHPAHAKQ